MKNQFVSFHLDFIGFSVSILCAIHCAALPLVLSLAPLAGLHFLSNPWIEYTILFLSYSIASMGILNGYRKHHRKPLPLILVITGFVFISTGYFSELEWMEVLFMVLGGITIAIAHFNNYSARLCAHKE